MAILANVRFDEELKVLIKSRIAVTNRMSSRCLWVLSPFNRFRKPWMTVGLIEMSHCKPEQGKTTQHKETFHAVKHQKHTCLFDFRIEVGCKVKCFISSIHRKQKVNATTLNKRDTRTQKMLLLDKLAFATDSWSGLLHILSGFLFWCAFLGGCWLGSFLGGLCCFLLILGGPVSETW